jgi:hypothetical protein
MEKIEYQLPYFNDTQLLRRAYQAKYPDYNFDMISAVMVGGMSTYIPTEVFDRLILDTLKEAN